ncbi:MAG: hypothetical protein ACLS26_10330 [Eubacterium sp.]
MCKEQKSINIGIVNYGANTENGKGRLKGFTDYINKIDNAKIVDTVNVESNKESATAGAKKLLKKAQANQCADRLQRMVNHRGGICNKGIKFE